MPILWPLANLVVLNSDDGTIKEISKFTEQSALIGSRPMPHRGWKLPAVP